MTMSGDVNDRLFVVDDVVGEVRIARRTHLGCAGLQLGQEPHEPAHVVALGKALAGHQSARFERRVGEEESVRRHEVDARVVGPTCEQRLQHPGDRALAGGDAARDADDVRARPRGGDRETSRSRRAARASPRRAGSAAATTAGRPLRPRRIGMGSPRPRSAARSSSASDRGVDARSRLHSSRVKSTYGSSSGSSDASLLMSRA